MQRRAFLRLLGGAIVAACTAALPRPSPPPTPPATPPSAPPTSSPSPPATTTPSPTASTVPDAPPSVVYRGGTILTMDPEQERAAALAFRGERIVAVGDEGDVLAAAGPTPVVIDLDDRALLPGFNDAHCHRLGDRDVWGMSTAEEAIEQTLADGFTSISELFVNQERLDELVALDGANRLRLRVNAYLPVNYLEDKFGYWFDHLRPHQQLSPRVRIGGVKAFADKADSRLLLLSADHPLQPGYRGDQVWADNELADLVAQLHADGWQVCIHTCGDAAHDMVLDAFAAALGGAPNAARHRIEHLMVLRDDQISRMAEMGIVASFQFGWFNSLWTADWEADLPGWTDRLGRWRDLLDAGVPAVGSTDCPWAPPVGPAMRAIEDVVTRRAEGEARPAEWQRRQRLTVAEALPLLTARGAWATFEEADKGMLRPGLLADMVVLSADPADVRGGLISETDVLATIIGGVAEFCATGAEGLCPPGSD